MWRGTLLHGPSDPQRGRGDLGKRADFYERLFNFRQIRFFGVEGKLTGLFSKAMTSPDGKIRIRINKSAGDKRRFEERRRDYKGEGVLHVALVAR